MRALIRLSCKLNKFRLSHMLMRIRVNAFEPLARNHFPIWTLCIARIMNCIKGVRIMPATHRNQHALSVHIQLYIVYLIPIVIFNCVCLFSAGANIIILLCRQKKSVAARSPQLSVCCLCDCVRIHNNVIISTCISIDCRTRREYACLQAQL